MIVVWDEGGEWRLNIGTEILVSVRCRNRTFYARVRLGYSYGTLPQADDSETGKAAFGCPFIFRTLGELHQRYLRFLPAEK